MFILFCLLSVQTLCWVFLYNFICIHLHLSMLPTRILSCKVCELHQHRTSIFPNMSKVMYLQQYTFERFKYTCISLDNLGTSSYQVRLLSSSSASTSLGIRWFYLLKHFDSILLVVFGFIYFRPSLFRKVVFQREKDSTSVGCWPHSWL